MLGSTACVPALLSFLIRSAQLTRARLLVDRLQPDGDGLFSSRHGMCGLVVNSAAASSRCERLVVRQRA